MVSYYDGKPEPCMVFLYLLPQKTKPACCGSEIRCWASLFLLKIKKPRTRRSGRFCLNAGYVLKLLQPAEVFHDPTLGTKTWTGNIVFGDHDIVTTTKTIKVHRRTSRERSIVDTLPRFVYFLS